jgi:hypothetical protein
MKSKHLVAGLSVAALTLACAGTLVRAQTESACSIRGDFAYSAAKSRDNGMSESDQLDAIGRPDGYQPKAIDSWQYPVMRAVYVHSSWTPTDAESNVIEACKINLLAQVLRWH